MTMTSPFLIQVPGDTPDVEHPAVALMRPRWRRCRDVYDGTDAIHAAGERYLPRFPAESPDNYRRRSTSTEFYNAFARTVGGTVGLVFQRDPILGDDNPPAVRDHWENIDGAGRHGTVFARDLFTDAMIVGHGGILVDYPAVADPDTVTLATERALALRPYWVRVRAEDIVSWRFTQFGGLFLLTQLVLREEVERPLGAFGVALVTRYRVFRLDLATQHVTWELWEPEQVPGEQATIPLKPIASGIVRNQERIPFAPFIIGPPGQPVTSLTSKPPLLDLADANLAHYRVAADRRHVMSLACTPTPVRIGVPDDAPPIILGPTSAIDIPSPDGDVKFLEPSGAAFQPTQSELDMLERRMAALGLAFLMSDTRAAETAEAKRIDTAQQNATLATAARGLQDALEQALDFHARYLGQRGGSIAVNTDFEQTVMAPEVMDAYARMVDSDKLSLEMFWDLLRQGRRLPDSFDADTEKVRILARTVPNPPAGGQLDGGGV
jgi:hypothetical protein